MKRTILLFAIMAAIAMLTACSGDKPADPAADTKAADTAAVDAAKPPEPPADPAKIEAADIKPEQADAVATALEKEIADDLASEQ